MKHFQNLPVLSYLPVPYVSHILQEIDNQCELKERLRKYILYNKFICLVLGLDDGNLSTTIFNTSPLTFYITKQINHLAEKLTFA